jgi:hypothetical protein
MIFAFLVCMSQAFVRESDEQWLHDVSPSLNALIVYLTRENNGVRVYEQKKIINKQGQEVYHMSNGLAYTHDQNGRWCVEW